MQSERDLTAADRIEAVAELVTRGMNRLAMQKHERDRDQPGEQEASGAGSLSGFDVR